MEVISAEFVKSSDSIKLSPKPNKPEFAFIGRSNVGKSSLINCITSRKKLAKTSSTPGKTKLINHFLVNNGWYLVDLPGYGWAKVSKSEKIKWEGMIRDYILKRENLLNVFTLIDCRLEPQQIDLEFIEWLGKSEIAFGIIFTKADKLSKNKVQFNISKYKSRLLRSWEELPPIFITSAENGDGKEEILDYIEKIQKGIDFELFLGNNK